MCYTFCKYDKDSETNKQTQARKSGKDRPSLQGTVVSDKRADRAELHSSNFQPSSLLNGFQIGQGQHNLGGTEA